MDFGKDCLTENYKSQSFSFHRYSKMEDFENGEFWFLHGGDLLEKLGLLHYTMPWMNRKFLKFFQDQGNEEACEMVSFPFS